jgi:hypothetical protein
MRKMITRQVAFTAALVWHAAGFAEPCKVEKAHYRYTSAEYNATADFLAVHSEWVGHRSPRTALHLRLPLAAHGQATFLDDWFVFDQGSSQRIYLMNSTSRSSPSWAGWDDKRPVGPLDTLFNFYAWSAQHVVLESPPSSGDVAPEYIFLPELHALIQGISGVSPLPGMFVLDRCDA